MKRKKHKPEEVIAKLEKNNAVVDCFTGSGKRAQGLHETDQALVGFTLGLGSGLLLIDI